MTLLTVLKLLHLAGLMMGFGGAILADMLILRRAILSPIKQETVETVHHLSKIVFGGLALLWISGASLIYLRYSLNPDVLMNQKIWAKVTIVSILTINVFAVHKIALAHLQSRIGKQLFDPRQKREMIGLTFVAAVSSVSWGVPFVLGVASEFNFTVPAISILSIYIGLIGAAWLASYSLAMFVSGSSEQIHHNSTNHFAANEELRQRIEKLTGIKLPQPVVDRHPHLEGNDGYFAQNIEGLKDVINRLKQYEAELTSKQIRAA